MTEQLTIEDAIEQRNGVLWLIANDPKMEPSTRAVAETIARRVKPGDRVSANSIREHLPPWINPQAIGPAFGTLTRRRALEVLLLVPSTDRGTHGKRVAVYLVTPAALEDVAA